MTLSPGRRMLLETVSEETWQAHVLRVAKDHGWWTYHPRDSRGSAHGWPDLVLLRPPRALFVECKSGRGVVSDHQEHVLGLLRACGLDARVWYPTDEEEMEKELA